MQRQLDLRTGKPVWTAYRVPKVPVTPLARDARCDVLIVGLGISGALIAEALTAQGLSVIAIDRRDGAMLGSTAATTALVQFEIDQPLSKLTRSIGKEPAVQAWRRSRLAVANLWGRIDRLGISCNLALRPSLLLEGDVLDRAGLEAEGEARRAAGLAADFLPRKRVRDEYGIDRAALLATGNLSLDPRKLAAGLFQLAIERGARLHAPVKATGFAQDADGVSVATDGGPTIRAGHVVLATGYELTDIVPPVPHRIVSTWAVSTVRQARAPWGKDAFWWEASDPYLYARLTHDGRIVCGGEDEDFQDEEQRDALIGEKTERIRAKLARMLPDADTRLDFAWTGSFGTTSSGLPFIGAIPNRPRIFATMGYGGNGITFSQIASEIISGAIACNDDSDAAIFALNR